MLVVEVARVVLGPEAFDDAELDTGADEIAVDDEMLVNDTMDDANNEAEDADEEFVGTDELLDDPDDDDELAVELAEFVTVEEFVVMVFEDETVDALEIGTDDEEFVIELPKLVTVEELEAMVIEDETVDELEFDTDDKELVIELPKLVAIEEFVVMVTEDETADVLEFELILELDTDDVAVADPDAVPDETILTTVGLI